MSIDAQTAVVQARNSDIAVRPAQKQDVPLIYAFIEKLADYEKLRHEVTATEKLLENHLFGSEPKAHVLIAEFHGKPVGFALYFFNFSTFLGKPGIYLEDLYVEPEHRGKGLGKALLQNLARVAVQLDCGRLEWSVLDWNTPSIEFYKSLGAKPMDEWTVYRVTGPALANLASTGT